MRFLTVIPVLLSGCGSAHVTIGDPAKAGHDGTDTSSDSQDTDSAGPVDTADTADTADSGSDTADSDVPAPDCEAYGFVADLSANVAYGATLDAWDASTGPYDAAKAAAAGSLASNSAADCGISVGGTVSGDVLSGAGSDPASAICLGYGATISGGQTALGLPIAVPTASVPAGAPASSGVLSLGWSESRAIGEDMTFDSVSLGYASALTVEKSVTLVVLGDLTVGTAPISIAPGETLDLYVGGNVAIGYGAEVNTSGSPSQLRLRFTGGGNLTQDYGGNLAAVVTEPYGDFANNGGQFSGTWIGHSLTSGWGAAFHADLARICPP